MVADPTGIANRMMKPADVSRRRHSIPRALIRFAVLALLADTAAAGDSMRCGNRLVSVGAIEAAVLAACGDPSWRDALGQADARYAADSEVWYYNLGPSQLIRVLQFRDGTLRDVGTDGYGFNAAPQNGCGPGDIVEGLSKYRLILQCGEPLSKRVRTVLVPWQGSIASAGGRAQWDSGYRRAVYREEWVYNFGSRYFLRSVTLEDGVVTEVENGDRGFDPH